MKKIYTIMLLVFLSTGIMMAQYPQAWSFWQAEMAGDYKANVDALYKNRKEYKIWFAPESWDAATSSVEDVWDLFPGDTLNKFISGNREPVNADDFTGVVKYMYDLDNLYVLLMVKDNYIYPADSSKSEEYELMYAPYVDSLTKEKITAIAPAYVDSAWDARQVFGYWKKAGAFKTSLSPKGDTYVDYEYAYNPGASVGWAADITQIGVTSKFTKLTNTEYAVKITVPFDKGMANFVPEAGKSIALELKVVDKDNGEAKNVQATANTTVNDLWALMCYTGKGTFQAEPSAVASSNKVSVKIHPNPASEYITVSNAKLVSSLDIMNVNGQVVGSYKNVSGQISISNLNKGLYFVKVKDVNNNSSVQKLIVK